jgi:membrane protein implicated in regulation of membrane protease activity
MKSHQEPGRGLIYLVRGLHLLHAAWWIMIAIAAFCFFFSGLDWRMDLVTGILMAPLVVIAVAVYKRMFRKKSVPSQTLNRFPSAVDPIQHARDKAR